MIRENWRVILLTVLLVLSGIALFMPGMGAGTAATDTGPTNLDYGLELSGGTRLRAPVVGMTAEGVSFPASQESQIEQSVAEQLGADVVDVQARPGQRTVEVFTRNVTKSEFRDALAAVDLQAETIRDGVTNPTRETIVATVESKINAVGFSGANVQQVRTATGEHYIVIEVPNKNASQVRDLVDERGVVQLVAYYPKNGTQTNATVITRDDIAAVDSPTTSQGRAAVPISLTQSGAENFAQDMKRFGFTSDQGIGNCHYAREGDTDYCLLTVLDGEVVYSASMGRTLANSIESGDFVKDPRFIITATNMSEARELQINLRAGALPAPLNLEEGTTYYLAPSLAERFKTNALVTGIFAALAVAGVVFLRYGKPEVAAPMVVTALSEVIILLGFAAATGLALDLSHIAGFIAVIGTGVDDLVIIADEVMTEQVSSRKVFQSRFRKALWIIGAAAATTIIAMSPLAVLALGDLRGFAIITILGVLIGVLVTRPAYGDILRRLLTENR